VLPALIRKFHLAKLLRDRDFDLIRQDVKKYPIGFGLDKDLDLDDEQAICNVLEKVGITGDHVVLWGAGEVMREFLYADDLADACIFLMENHDNKKTGEFVNIGTGSDIKIKDLGILIKEIVEFTGEIRRDLNRPDGTPRKLLDVSRINRLGWEAKISLSDGIRKTYEWYRKEQSLIK